MFRLRNRNLLHVAAVAAGALTIAVCQLAQAATFGSAKDAKEITAIEMKAATETDVDTLMQNFAPDAVAADWAMPGWYVGRDEIAAAYAPQLAAVKTMKMHMDAINIASDDTFACAAMQIHFDATLGDGGTPFVMTIRQLDALKKINGRWLIIQEHVSVPVDEKTGNAVMNGPLRPRGRLRWSTTPALGPAESPNAAKKDIRRWLETSATPTDLNDMMHYYGPGNDIILYDIFYPGEHRGQKEIRNYYAPQLAATRDFQVKIPAFFADSDGAFGVQIDKQDLKLTMKDGSTQVMSFRQSDCLRRVDGKWHSFFEMGSFPIDAKTGKALMTNPTAFQ